MQDVAGQDVQHVEELPPRAPDVIGAVVDVDVFPFVLGVPIELRVGAADDDARALHVLRHARIVGR